MEYRFGAYPTMITPYKADGSVDYDMAERYVEWYFEKGCAGIFAICQSSEIFYLTVEERAELNRRVYAKAQELKKNSGKAFTIVSSGHVADSIEDQAYELNKVIETGTDALILITNRLDLNNEGDDVWIKNAERLLSMLPEDVNLGLYECPHPYKRLVTPKILKWCIETDRFYYMKDTCCDAKMIKERLDIIKGTHFNLLNANCQTLLQSLKDGGAGYCGIMANFHPELYAWLCENYRKVPEKAEEIQNLIGTCGFTENGLPYPLTAKYHMCLEGLETVLTARNRKDSEMTDYVKDCVSQMRALCKTYIDKL
ncbi:MAG: dihydrodipicolinate synthase family protein [Clostridia bacterium]|nr:dihydrodipicolinate synthase family protein [Clostridia bacterium]